MNNKFKTKSEKTT